MDMDAIIKIVCCHMQVEKARQEVQQVLAGVNNLLNGAAHQAQQQAKKTKPSTDLHAAKHYKFGVARRFFRDNDIHVVPRAATVSPLHARKHPKRPSAPLRPMGERDVCIQRPPHPNAVAHFLLAGP
jgi:hypothetical protein